MFADWSTPHVQRVTVNNHVHIAIMRLRTNKRVFRRKYMSRPCYEKLMGSKMIYGPDVTKYAAGSQPRSQGQGKVPRNEVGGRNTITVKQG